MIRMTLGESIVYRSDPGTICRSLNRCYLRHCYIPGREEGEKTAEDFEYSKFCAYGI